MTKLANRKAIITGGASGIGEAIAQAFLAEGAEVFVVDLPNKELAQTYGDTPKAHILEQDITAENAAETIVAGAIDAMGSFDVLSIMLASRLAASLKPTDELWDQIMGINVTAMFKVSRAAPARA